MILSSRIYFVAIGLPYRVHWTSDRINQLSYHILVFFQYDGEGNILPSPVRVVAEELAVVIVVYWIFP